MKSALSIFLLFLAFSSHAQQKETFDLATYTVPNGWKNVSTEYAAGYATTNNLKGTYCQIAIYKSRGSKASLQADFESEWQELVVKPYKPSANPELVPAASDEGWQAQSGVAPFEFSGGQSIAMLVTMRGFGRCQSIVILTNTQDYQTEIENFLGSVDLKKPEANTNQLPNTPLGETPISAKKTGYAFSTTNFDDGWVSTMQEDWVQVVKGTSTVLIHYPNKNADAYNSVLMDGLKNGWNILVAPRYSSASNFEFKPVTGWQSIEFAEADMVDEATGKTVYVVLFKINYSNGSGKYLEFITPNKASFEQEFGPYHETSYGWEKMENMANYNKFAVGATDLNGKWTNNFSGMTQYVNAYTGADAGATSHASSQVFYFSGGTYQWEIAVASGAVGNLKFQNTKSNGKLSLISNWQIKFSDMEGKPKTYDAYFSCIKGARMLWLSDVSYPGYTGYGKVE